MCSAYSVLNETDARLAPFRVPSGLPESDVVARLFANFRQVFTTFTRVNREQSLASITAASKDRHVRIYEEGETVFRRMPKGSRMPKGLFPPPSRGPYVVVSQPDKFNVVLKNATTGALVDNGARIPLDQILSGPRRARLRLRRKMALEFGQSHS